MKRFAIAACALMFATASVISAPDAEARGRGWGGGGGFLAAAIVGGIAIAALSRHRHRSYGYYPQQSYAYYSAPRYYGGGYRGFGGRRHR